MKLGTLLMFGAGYVLGSKAGRERYEQICRMAQMASERLEEYSLDSGRAPADAVTSDSGQTQRETAAL